MSGSTRHKNERRFVCLGAAAALAAVGWVGCGIATPGRAQSMDYGALQQLFGEPVTTSAIGTPQRARDVPADVEIVTADDIRRSGAADIPGVLSHVLGVDVTRWSVLGADVSIRGYNGPMTPHLLVLIDGRQVYVDDYGHTEWHALPVELSEIRQIEVVKGPNSALFGFNAAGGVINIITFNPLYDRLNTASVAVGTQGYKELSAVASDKIGSDVGIKLSAGGTLSNDFASVRGIAGGLGLRRDTSRDQFSADVHWQINSASELEVQVTHGEDQRLALTPLWLPVYVRTQLDSALARYKADTPLGLFTATAYSDWTYATSNISAGGPLIDSEYRTQLTVTQLQDEFTAGADHTFRLTTEFRHNGVNTEPGEGGTVSYDIASAGASWTWNMLPSLSFTSAGRADALWLARHGGGLGMSPYSNADWARQSVEPSYNFGLVWHPLEADRFRLTVARGVQLPSLLEFGGVQGIQVGPETVSGSPRINPTTVNNYELDWDHDFASLNVQSRIAVFYQTTSDIQSSFSPLGSMLAPTGAFLLFAGNVGDSKEVGAEFSLKGHFGDGWRWSLGYSPRLVRDSFYLGANIATTGVDYAHTTPRHLFNAGLGWSGGKWELDSFLHLQSSAAGLVETFPRGFVLAPLGAIVAFDARAAYRITDNLTVSLTGQNILFSSARQNGWSKTEQQVLARLTAHF